MGTRYDSVPLITTYRVVGLTCPPKNGASFSVRLEIQWKGGDGGLEPRTSVCKKRRTSRASLFSAKELIATFESHARMAIESYYTNHYIIAYGLSDFGCSNMAETTA